MKIPDIVNGQNILIMMVKCIGKLNVRELYGMIMINTAPTAEV